MDYYWLHTYKIGMHNIHIGMYIPRYIPIAYVCMYYLSTYLPILYLSCFSNTQS